MKDSKEKEHRISNLKSMIEKATKEDSEDAQDSFEQYNFDEFDDDASDDDYEIVDAEEMIDSLSKDYDKFSSEELAIDDEYVFKPSVDIDDDDSASDDEIDKEFIIKTKLEDSELPKDNQDFDFDKAISYDDEDFLSEKFDSFFDKKIRGYSIVSIASLACGIVFILISIFLFSSSTQRIVDNVISGEMNASGVLFALIGIFLLILGIYKMDIIKNPFEDVAESISNIEAERPKPVKKQEESIKKSATSNTDNIKKVGEMDISEFKNKLEKTQGKLDGVTYKTEDIPQNLKKQTTNSQKENESSNEEEHKKAQLDNESIEDIFAEMEDMEEVPIISIDSKEEK